jgi:hypothetical protein
MKNDRKSKHKDTPKTFISCIVAYSASCSYLKITTKWLIRTFSESHIRNLFGKNEKQLVSIEAGLENNDFPEENASGPCRDRTDDPQIKSVSDEDESMPG